MKIPAFLPLILWMASVPCCAQTLFIGLYDYSDLSAKETVRLTETADLVFAHSGIHVVWSHCRGALAAVPGPTCEGQMQINEIVVRLRPGGPRSFYDGRMGHTMVTAERGYYASVFVGSVRAQAAGFGLAFDILMGYAVAHEVGHCLLGPGHAHAGLMRGEWNRKDASEISRLGLHLTKQEARRAVAALGAAVGNRASEEAALMVASASASPLRVVVYDQVRLTKEVAQTAFEDLRKVFHQAGIEMDLVAGDTAAPEAALITYPAPPPKGHEQEAACLARRDIAIEILAVAPALAQLKNTILGVAQPLARAGLNARVFDDRIQDAALRENRTHAAVLAHVIAHEIGHVLLRTNAHSRRGLMSAQWTDYEYGTIARSLMFFTPDQSKIMRMAISGAGCANDAAVNRRRSRSGNGQLRQYESRGAP